MRWYLTGLAAVGVMCVCGFGLADEGLGGVIELKNGTRLMCSARAGRHDVFPAVACAGVCARENEVFPPKSLRGGAADVVCTRRDGSVWHEVDFPVVGTRRADWWLECIAAGVKVPSMSTPRLLRKPAPPAACAAPAATVAHLNASLPKVPKAVFVYSSTSPFSHSTKLAMASTALYALAHGYHTVYYDAMELCAEWEPRGSVHGRVFKGRDNREFCGMGGKRCCWMEGFYIHPNWVKPAALLAAAQQYADTQWLVSVDIDATMRHLGYSVPQWAEYTSNYVFDSKHTCGDGRGCNGRQPLVTKQNMVLGAREMIGDGMALNTGVLAVNGADSSERQRFFEKWWELRNHDCKMAGTRLCRKDIFGCQRVMSRLYNSGDQTGLNLHGGTILANISEVPHLMFNGHGGLFALHMYGGSTKASGTDQRAFEEALTRHAAGIHTYLCNEGKGDGTCADPKYVARHPGNFTTPHKCYKAWGAEWVELAIGTVRFRKLSPPAGMRDVGAKCFNFMNDFLANWQTVNTKRLMSKRRR